MTFKEPGQYNPVACCGSNATGSLGNGGRRVLGIEFRPESRYSRTATSLSVRLFSRDRTGWRRDEWAECPLFIWGELHRMAAAGTELRSNMCEGQKHCRLSIIGVN